MSPRVFSCRSTFLVTANEPYFRIARNADEFLEGNALYVAKFFNGCQSAQPKSNGFLIEVRIPWGAKASNLH